MLYTEFCFSLTLFKKWQKNVSSNMHLGTLNFNVLNQYPFFILNFFYSSLQLSPFFSGQSKQEFTDGKEMFFTWNLFSFQTCFYWQQMNFCFLQVLVGEHSVQRVCHLLSQSTALCLENFYFLLFVQSIKRKGSTDN